MAFVYICQLSKRSTYYRNAIGLESVLESNQRMLT